MAVSKRTRYEVLRRDNHTCRYCGATAPEVVLTVDHVTPIALGGSDDPDNLVAACQDCNAGKSSVQPGADLIADVRATDLRWASAIMRVSEQRAVQRTRVAEYIDQFEAAWTKWNWGFNGKYSFELPLDWPHSIERFYELGVPIQELTNLVDVACSNNRLNIDGVFRYFAGCVWRYITEVQEAAKELLDAEDLEGGRIHQPAGPTKDAT